ncbi:Hypothetical protein R9X50_00097600 [Acrodontium crateriforme]|uniref:Uncharacterized protein n=1 Tax=Acrodontium crateriforme TaxID=150365 RepID=A0AAQ3R2F0_9PEZI|nr:Hypothetical protein R9X50_00097600 [Acrodontium crateriforme]
MIFSRLFATAGLLTLASATCQLSNAYTGGDIPDTYKSDKLCLPQGEGDWTFSLYTSAVDVPTFNGGNPNAGYAGGFTYLMYDNACNLRGLYGPSGNNCGIPFVIEENYLAQVLTITSENTGVGGAYFSFDYGNGEFSINNNQCGCQDMSSGLQGAQGCKCAFPVSGVLSKKRSIEFEA